MLRWRMGERERQNEVNFASVERFLCSPHGANCCEKQNNGDQVVDSYLRMKRFPRAKQLGNNKGR